MWLPYLILAFPGLSTGDTLDELCQYFHLETWTLRSINLLNPDVYINQHHSVLHTVVLGLIFSFGKLLGSFTFGAFVYVMLQVLLLIIIFSFMIKYMCKIKINSYIILFSLLFVGLEPTVVTYAICAIKDTPSAIFNLLYVIFLLQLVRNFDSIYKSKLRIFTFIFVIMMVLLLRNNGIYTFVGSFVWLFFLYKKKWKKLLLTFMVPLLLFGTYSKILLPSLDITKGSPREALSIPIMQIARVIRDKPDVFTEEDKRVINNMFNFQFIQVFYDPDISDEVKELYNKDASKKEVKEFFGVWFKYLKKEPRIYIESVVNSTYGYFYPGKNRDILYLYNFRFRKQPFFDIITVEKFTPIRHVINKLIDIYYSVPFFMNQVAYYDWILIFSGIYVVVKKKCKYLIPLMALGMTLLSCIASPLNGSFRYILPIVFSLPIILAIDYLVYKESK